MLPCVRRPERLCRNHTRQRPTDVSGQSILPNGVAFKLGLVWIELGFVTISLEASQSR